MSEIVKFVKASTFFISAHLKISTLFVISHILRAKVSPEWWLNSGFGTQKRCPFNRGNRYKDYGNIFPGPNFVPPEWRSLLNRVVPKERFHCTAILRFKSQKRNPRSLAFIILNL